MKGDIKRIGFVSRYGTNFHEGLKEAIEDGYDNLDLEIQYSTATELPSGLIIFSALLIGRERGEK